MADTKVTVDNLGLRASIRYAKDMEMLDAQLVQDSRFIPSKTETSVLRPYVPAEFESLFQTGTATIWALFNAPPAPSGQNLFSFQLIPSLGSDEEHFQQLEDVLKKPLTRKQGDPEREQKEKEQQEEKERKILLHLIEVLSKLDKTLLLINARRNQYQRG